MVFALNFRQKTDEQVNKLDIAQELAQQIEELQRRIGQEFTLLNEADAARRRFLETLKGRLKADGLAVEIDEANGILRLTEKAVRFAPDKSDLDPPARTNVQKIANALAETLPAFTQCPESMKCPASSEANRVETVFIEGHTDVTGLDDRNWQLSTERAVNTYRAIIETAPSLRKLRNGEKREVLSVSGYSSTRPASIGQSRENHDLNRRIDLRFVMEANQRERLSEVSRLLREMELKIQMLRGPGGGRVESGWETKQE
jgi:flagellar motor protein MotB